MKQYVVKTVECFPSYVVLTVAPKKEASRLQFWPGQYVTLGFKDGGKWTPMRCFSITSSPNNSELQFAMRPTGRFTRKIAQLTPGTAVRLQGPFGKFVIDPQYDRNIIMLAAGIGITPFMSMLCHAAESHLENPITLLYACRSLNDMPFYDEIARLQAHNLKLRVVFVVNQGQADPERRIYKGRINETLLQKVTGQRFQNYSYFICGPKSFSQGIQQILTRQAVDESHIITESFTQATRLGWNFSRLSIPTLTYATTGAVFVAGFAIITGLDVSRFTAKTVAAQSQTAIPPASPSNNTTSSTDSSSASNDSATSTTAPTDTSMPTQATTPPTTYTQTYQSPVSSVS